VQGRATNERRIRSWGLHIIDRRLPIGSIATNSPVSLTGAHGDQSRIMDCRNCIPSLPTALASGIIEDWTDRNFFALYPESCPVDKAALLPFETSRRLGDQELRKSRHFSRNVTDHRRDWLSVRPKVCG
jgi:hypothetical protein